MTHQLHTERQVILKPLERLLSSGIKDHNELRARAILSIKSQAVKQTNKLAANPHINDARMWRAQEALERRVNVAIRLIGVL